jgi:exodeoxyribonuclease V alpha subunit
MSTTLTGQIEHITFTNDENGYTIARVRLPQTGETVTIVGTLLAPMPGELLEMQGEWHHHPRYGRQFKVRHASSRIPASADGIRKYLGSGMIKGLGPVMAERIVDRFGSDTLDIIDRHIDRLAEVDGIGEKRIDQIAKAWETQREIRDVMVFLQSKGVSSTYAAKIFKRYGSRSVSVVRANPYRLAGEIVGIGFLTADRIAAHLGFANDAPQRIQAGILFVLERLAGDGHVFYPFDDLAAQCVDILLVKKDAVEATIEALARRRKLVIDPLEAGRKAAAVKQAHRAVYLTHLHRCETGIALRLHHVATTPASHRPIDVDKALRWVQQRMDMTLAAKQVTAVRTALSSKVTVITGGPGTGKTTIVKTILQIFQRRRVGVQLAAPTGRAAKRMSEACGFEARTLHRLLEYNLQQGGFQRNADHPLDADVVVVDEASMIDTVLMHHLLKAFPPAATLILVGDVDQLPSVGPGSVLADIIRSKTVAVSQLTRIFRQARTSRIIVNAHAVNDGRLPDLKNDRLDGLQDDFYFIEQEDPRRVVDIIQELVRVRIPRRFGFDAFDDIQVLSPMHKGVLGAANLNRELQQLLNRREEGIARGDEKFLVADKVMQVRNNYDKAVFNGDIGRIARLDLSSRELVVRFDGRDVPYEFSELDEIVLAYAVSVHKSQGSEYPAVVIPIHTQHYVLLQRNLIYTAVTRGRRLVVLVGSRRALAIGVNNNKTRRRHTLLGRRLGFLAGSSPAQA